MTVLELIAKLSELSPEDQALPVYVQDGMDPSDPYEADRVFTDEDRFRFAHARVLRIE